MPKGYWVTVYRSISDPQKLAAYAQLAPPAIAPFGGRYLARGTAAKAYEAGQKERVFRYRDGLRSGNPIDIDEEMVLFLNHQQTVHSARYL